MLNSKLRLIVLVFNIILIMGMVACADTIDTHNNSFREIIEELQSRIIALEGAESGENHLIYPQQWATGDGTAGNPWANSCIESAYSACPTNGTIFLKAGYYQLAGQLNINKKINIVGEGRNKTMIKTAVGLMDGFRTENIDYITFKHLTIDGDAQTDGGDDGNYPCCIRIANCDYAVFEDIELKNAGYYGIDAYQVNHSSFQNIYAHDNWRHGMHPGSNVEERNKYNTYRDIYCWDNGIDGFDDRGGGTAAPSYNTYDNLQCWDNGEIGIAITDQSGIVLSDASSYGNGREGMYLSGLKDSNIHNCIVCDNNIEAGLRLLSSKNINLTNVIARNNDLYGIWLQDSTEIKLTSCQSYADQDTPPQYYGLGLTGTTTEISLVNCKLTPNINGAIDNPANATIIQWPNGDNGDLTQLTADFNALKTEYEALLARIKTASEVVNE